MCQLAGISRSGFIGMAAFDAAPGGDRAARRYSTLGPQASPLCQRRIGALLRRQGWQANHKRVLRLMGEGRPFVLAPDPVCANDDELPHSWRVVPNLARGIVLNVLDELWVANISYPHLAEEFGYPAVILDAFGRKVYHGYAHALPA